MKKEEVSFTAIKGNKSLTYQKPKFRKGEFGDKEKVQAVVTVTLSVGAEFNVDKEFEVHNKFSKMAKAPTAEEPNNGVLTYVNGESKRIPLDKARFLAFLKSKVNSPDGKITYWSKRPRPEAEKKLEEALKGKDVKIASLEAELEKFRKPARKN